MLRKLIALLVLITGLAAIGQPAQARIVDLDRVGLSALETGPSYTAQAHAQAVQFVSKGERDEAPAKACTKPPRIVIVPTVMLQADRARE